MKFSAQFRVALVLVLVLPAWVAATGAVLPPAASIAELPPLPDDTSSGANDINQAGVVVGRSFTASNGDFVSRRAVQWRNGQVQPLPMPAGISNSAAFAIDGLGRMAGEAGQLGGVLQAFRLIGTKLQWLGTSPPGANSFAGEMNNRAEAVGGTDVDGGDDRALLWIGTQLFNLPPLPGRASATAIAINFHRDSIGIAYNQAGSDAVDERAVTWRGTRLFALPQLPGGSRSAAEDINNLGQIAGWADDAGGIRRPVFWQNGRINLLPAPDPTVNTIAYINSNTGLIIGISGDEAGDFQTLMWDRGRLFVLNDLLPPGSGWTNLDPFSINDRGQLVGRGSLNGNTRAFLITIRRR